MKNINVGGQVSGKIKHQRKKFKWRSGQNIHVGFRRNTQIALMYLLECKKNIGVGVMR